MIFSPRYALQRNGGKKYTSPSLHNVSVSMLLDQTALIARLIQPRPQTMRSLAVRVVPATFDGKKLKNVRFSAIFPQTAKSQRDSLVQTSGNL